MTQTYLNLRGNARWAVIMVRFPDIDTDPLNFTADYFTSLFTDATPGVTGGMAAYWSEVSFRNIDLDGTVVLGPITIGHWSTYYDYDHQDSFFQDALNAWWYPDAEDPGYDVNALLGFDRIVFVTNADTNMRTGGRAPLPPTAKLRYPWPFGGRADLALALLEPASWNPQSAAHEMGHGFGLEHAFDEGPATCGDVAPFNRPGEYCDPYDIMGGANAHTVQGPFGPRGPGLSAPHLLEMGWIAPERIVWATGKYRTTIMLDPLERPDATGTALIAFKLRNAQTGADDIYTVEYRIWGSDVGLVVHRWDTRGVSILLAAGNTRLFDGRTPYVDVLNRFQVGLLRAYDDYAEVEIGPVGPSAYLDVTQTTVSESMIDEDAFHFPFEGAGREVENLCGVGDFHYRAYGQRQRIECRVNTYWATGIASVYWAIDGSPVPAQGSWIQVDCVRHVLRTFALPAPYGSQPRYADVTLEATVSMDVIELMTKPGDGNYGFELTATVTATDGKTASASARFEVVGQRLDVYGGWDEFIRACNIARLVWLKDIRNHPMVAVPRPAHDGPPHLPRNPGDPPSWPDAARTLELLAWCAEHAPERLEDAALGALRLHGLVFAQALHDSGVGARLPWGGRSRAHASAPASGTSERAGRRQC